MSDLLPDWPLFAAFLAASFVLAVTPGPGVLYIVTRTLAQGRASGLASVAGVALGNLGNAAAASLGLAAVLALSSTAFAVLKYAGAAYLIYLGIKALRSREVRKVAAVRTAAARRVFVDGFLVALLNPKTALFFAAFLPQFLTSGSSSAAQTVLLGSLFVAIAAATDTLYALTAATLAPAPQRGGWQAAGRYCAGGVLIGLGLLTALSGRRVSAAG